MNSLLISRCILPAAIVLWASACMKETPVETAGDPARVLPLATGNYWEYRRCTVDSSGTQSDSTVITMRVGDADTLGSETGYHLADVIMFLGTTPGGPVIWTNKADGLYEVVGRPIPFEPDISRALPFPTFIGDTLSFRNWIIRTAAINEFVSVPAGEFSSIRYDVFRGEILVAQLWVRPAVGIISTWQQYGFSVLEDQLAGYEVAEPEGKLTAPTERR